MMNTGIDRKISGSDIQIIHSIALENFLVRRKNNMEKMPAHQFIGVASLIGFILILSSFLEGEITLRLSFLLALPFVFLFMLSRFKKW